MIRFINFIFDAVEIAFVIVIVVAVTKGIL